MHDIVFAEMYGPQVAAHINKVAHHALMNGRQQGWNEMIQIVQEILNSNFELNEENIKKYITEMLSNEQQSQEKAIESSNDEPKNTNPTPTKRKNHLSIVK